MMELMVLCLVVVHQMGMPVMLQVMMMRCRMDEYIQSTAPPGRYGNNWYPQHLRKTMHIDFHPPMDYDIHHVQSQHHRLSQFQKLQREIEVPLQRGSVRHIDDHIHLIAEYVLPGYLFLHGVGSQAVGSCLIVEPVGMVMIFH